MDFALVELELAGRQTPPEYGSETGLVWHHTEFGRRTECGRFRIVRNGETRCQLLDADWTLLGEGASIAEMQKLADRLMRKERP